MKHRQLFFFAFFLLALAIGLGAFGSHGLKHSLPPEALANWETGIQYQFWNTLGALILLVLAEKEGVSPRFAHVSALLMIGVLLFSGMLYVYVLTGMKFLVYLVPIGGTLMLLAWGFAAVLALRSRPVRDA